MQRQNHPFRATLTAQAVVFALLVIAALAVASNAHTARALSTTDAHRGPVSVAQDAIAALRNRVLGRAATSTAETAVAKETAEAMAKITVEQEALLASKVAAESLPVAQRQQLQVLASRGVPREAALAYVSGSLANYQDDVVKRALVLIGGGESDILPLLVRENYITAARLEAIKKSYAGNPRSLAGALVAEVPPQVLIAKSPKMLEKLTAVLKLRQKHALGRLEPWEERLLRSPAATHATTASGKPVAAAATTTTAAAPAATKVSARPAVAAAAAAEWPSTLPELNQRFLGKYTDDKTVYKMVIEAGGSPKDATSAQVNWRTLRNRLAAGQGDAADLRSTVMRFENDVMNPPYALDKRAGKATFTLTSEDRIAPIFREFTKGKDGAFAVQVLAESRLATHDQAVELGREFDILYNKLAAKTGANRLLFVESQEAFEKEIAPQVAAFEAALAKPNAPRIETEASRASKLANMSEKDRLAYESENSGVAARIALPKQKMYVTISHDSRLR